MATKKKAAKKSVRRGPPPKSSVAKAATKRVTISTRATPKHHSAHPTTAAASTPLLNQLLDIEENGPGQGDGTLQLGRGISIPLTSLRKLFWKQERITKGQLLRYYVQVTGYINPALRDRPLVQKRFPDGIDGFTFYQQKAPDNPPKGVRTAEIVSDDGEAQQRVIGGDLATLLYLVQVGCVSMDPWHSRIKTLDTPDYFILDLDPMPRASFSRVIDVARHVRNELDRLGITGKPKTSGSTGIHIYVPLKRGVSYEDAVGLGRTVATNVANKYPKLATVERMVKNRASNAVYVDFLQSSKTKAIASAYAARAKRGATVSTPLKWSEVVPGLDPREWTVLTAPDRFRKVGDIWNE